MPGRQWLLNKLRDEDPECTFEPDLQVWRREGGAARRSDNAADAAGAFSKNIGGGSHSLDAPSTIVVNGGASRRDTFGHCGDGRLPLMQRLNKLANAFKLCCQHHQRDGDGSGGGDSSSATTASQDEEVTQSELRLALAELNLDVEEYTMRLSMEEIDAFVFKCDQVLQF